MREHPPASPRIYLHQLWLIPQANMSPILFLHICAGSIGLLAGSVAVVLRKGSRNHGRTGTVFSVSMLVLAATGVAIAYGKSQAGNIIGGLVTFYMVSTAWMAGRQRDRRITALDWCSLSVALVLGTVCLSYGYRVSRGLIVPKDGVPAGMDFFFAFIVLIAAVGDAHVLIARGLSGAHRIARHLWRMCFGLFVASGSFFMGRQRIFPTFIRQSGLLIFLTVLPLLLLVFWLLRVLFTKHFHQDLRSPREQTFRNP